MRTRVWPISVIGSIISALRYELARLRGVPSMRGVVLSALAVSVLLTVPAARQMIGMAHSALMVPPQRLAQVGGHAGQAEVNHALSQAVSQASGLASQYASMPMDFAGAWVIGGGVAGMVLPGIAAALGAAWFGATSIGYEYRYGSGLLTFALVPRRGSVLIAKAIVAAVFGAVLCPATTVVAYGTARLGFAVAGTQVGLPAALLAPELRQVAMAALGGALGVFAGVVLRVRVLAVISALMGCALVAAFLPQSSSLLVPYLAEAAGYVVGTVPALSYARAAELLLTLPLAVMVIGGLVAVRRRRVA